MLEHKFLSLLQQNDYSCKGILELLSNVSELTRGDVSGYSKQVADHALILATSLGLSKTDAYYIYYAGLLHEIGLYCVPAKLQKTFEQKKLTASEKILFKQVPKMGYLLLMTVDILQPIANIILHHQEYLNGSGYPKGLKDKDIPFNSQVLGIIVDYHKICAGKFFQTKVEPFAGFSYIKENAGTLYNPELVEKFINILSFETSATSTNDNLIKSNDLKPGMILSRNLYHYNGLSLFPKGRILNKKDIEGILQIEETSKRKLEIFVKDTKAEDYTNPFVSKDLDLKEISILLGGVDVENL